MPFSSYRGLARMQAVTSFRSLILLLPLLLCCSCVTRMSALVFRYAETDYKADMADLYAGKGALYTDGKAQYVELPRYRVRYLYPVFGTIDDHPRCTSQELQGSALYRISDAFVFREFKTNNRLYYVAQAAEPPRLDKPGTEKSRLGMILVDEAQAAAVKARAKRRPLRQENIRGTSVDSERHGYTPAVYAAGMPLLLCVDVPLTVVQNVCLLPLVPVVALWPDPKETPETRHKADKSPFVDL